MQNDMKFALASLFLFISSYSYSQLLEPTPEETILSEYQWLFNDNGNLKCGPAEKEIIESKIDQCQFIDAFEMFPNPAASEVTIKFDGHKMPTTIIINNLQGRIVYKEALDQFNGRYNNTITLDQDISGLLIVTIIQAKETFTKKLLIN